MGQILGTGAVDTITTLNYGGVEAVQRLNSINACNELQRPPARSTASNRASSLQRSIADMVPRKRSSSLTAGLRPRPKAPPPPVRLLRTYPVFENDDPDWDDRDQRASTDSCILSEPNTETFEEQRTAPGKMSRTGVLNV